MRHLIIGISALALTAGGHANEDIVELDTEQFVKELCQRAVGMVEYCHDRGNYCPSPVIDLVQGTETCSSRVRCFVQTAGYLIDKHPEIEKCLGDWLKQTLSARN